MPAPLAKAPFVQPQGIFKIMTELFFIGIIVSISLLLAAGLAVYEHNPQIKQWVDESRRKIAFALHNLGDDLDPPTSPRGNSFRDASTREDESAEAVERRRKARQEILERGRMMEERRRSQQARSTKSKSFDDLVDEGGKLKPNAMQATTTAAETHVEQPGLRIRIHEAQGAALGSMLANPFTDEAHLEDFSAAAAPDYTTTQYSRSSSTATLPTSPVPPPKEPLEPFNPSTFDHIPQSPPPVPPKEPLSDSSAQFPKFPSENKQPRLLVDTDDISNHPSEALLDLTPTTSASSVPADFSEINNHSHPSNHSDPDFWSVHEWAENNSGPARFYTPPRSEVAAGEPDEDRDDSRSSSGDITSETGKGERISRTGSVSDMSVMSEVGGISTPGSWTEVGSQVSEDF
ncbi:MAG: hypothetical protein Q9208_001313 [Pyrenodesmia sp. 3 TL-2023]